MDLDFHAHFNLDDPAAIKIYADNCLKNNTRSAISGGLRYGARDYVPNDRVIDFCKQYSDILIPVAKVDLWDHEIDLSELRRWVDRGAKAVKFIYPYYPYDHDLYMPVYEECEKLGVPVLFHTGNYRPSPADIQWKRPILKNMDPLNLDRPARSFQKLHIVLAHLGTTFWRVQASEMLKMHANVYADLAGNGSWQDLSAESLAYLLRPYVFLCEDTSRYFRKLVFGSDSYINYPNVQTDAKLHYEQILRKIGATEDLRNAVMGGTVSAWMGLKD